MNIIQIKKDLDNGVMIGCETWRELVDYALKLEEAKQAVPKVALTDEQIMRLSEQSYDEYDATVLAMNPITEQEEYQTERRQIFSPIKFGRLIEAQIGPNAQLVEALKGLYDLVAEEVADGEYTQQAIKAKAALATAVAKEST